VLLVGTQDYLLNVVAWSLSPRAIYPIVLAVPPDFDPELLVAQAATLEFGREAPARWLIDLDAVARWLAASPAGPLPAARELPDP
jgi:hypothetical protein